MSSNNINYSIIIPHYNIPDLLSRCLRSIPERDDVQVIVVDDNSPDNDNYQKQIPELSRKNVEFYITRDGLGAGHARNIGLSYAKGKWIVFSDSDDFFVKDLPSLLDEFVDDNNDVIYFNLIMSDCYNTSKTFVSEDKKYLFKKFMETGDELYLRVCCAEPWGKFIKHRVITDNHISFQETKAQNDLLFSVKVGILASNVRFVDRPMYWYVIREGSLGHHKGEEPFDKICDRIFAWNSTQQFLENHSIKAKVFLPTLPLVNAFKHNPLIVMRLLPFLRRHHISFLRMMVGFFRYLSLRIINKENVYIANLLSKKSVRKSQKVQ